MALSAYIIRRGDGYAVQKTEQHDSGTEHEVSWCEGLTLSEAEVLAADCIVRARPDIGLSPMRPTNTSKATEQRSLKCLNR